jgi:glycosyltransferase involved in cell wall biosynthesis
MKVLITLPCLNLPGGVANYYSTLRKHLDRDKHYFEVGSRGDADTGFQVIKRLLSDWWRFFNALSKQPVDLAHINPSFGMKSLVRDGVLLLIAKWKKKKVLVFFRGWDPECETTIRRKFIWLFRKVYGQADAFIVLGTEFRAKLREFGIHKPTYLETTLIDDDLEYSTAADQSTKNPENASILFLSRLDHGKGLLESLQAFKLLQDTKPSVRLTIAGDGPTKSAAEDYASKERLKGVQFTGYISGREKHLAFQNSDIYLFTSFHEGMPNSVLEAMAYGLPVVTSAVGGLKDFFEQDRMGKIVNPHNPDNICHALAELLDDTESRAEIGEYNRHYAQRNFSASSVAKRLVGIYEQTI